MVEEKGKDLPVIAAFVKLMDTENQLVGKKMRKWGRAKEKSAARLVP